MPRTNKSDVRDIFDTNIDDDSLDAWIEIANELVDDIANADSSIDSTRLTKIEKLLSAHFASTEEPLVEEDSIGDSSATYQGEWGMNLRSTDYGQSAIVLDPTTTLSTLGKPSATVGVPDTKGIDT